VLPAAAAAVPLKPPGTGTGAAAAAPADGVLKLPDVPVLLPKLLLGTSRLLAPLPTAEAALLVVAGVDARACGPVGCAAPCCC
jgi:hypothetical protein